MNSMTYVIAFDKNGSAKDVTKRYAKAFNAKTRKYRVESLPSGDAWLARAMRVYRKRKCQVRLSKRNIRPIYLLISARIGTK